MNDRLPGTTWSNPIWYRGWRIFLDSDGFGKKFAFVHDAYDPTPLYSDDGPNDDRHGSASSVEAAKAEIDEYEDAQPVPAGSLRRMECLSPG